MTDQPTERMKSPTRDRAGFRILDIDNYAPFLLNAVSNAWQRQTSAAYRRDFDLGIVEWRVIAMLNIEPEITANRICEVIRLDKAAVSRSLKILDARGIATFSAADSDPRRRRWWLTELGQKVHAEILDIALDCEARMLTGIAPGDLDTYLRVMRSMLANLDAVSR